MKIWELCQAIGLVWKLTATAAALMEEKCFLPFVEGRHSHPSKGTAVPWRGRSFLVGRTLNHPSPVRQDEMEMLEDCWAKRSCTGCSSDLLLCCPPLRVSKVLTIKQFSSLSKLNISMKCLWSPFSQWVAITGKGKHKRKTKGVNNEQPEEQAVWMKKIIFKQCKETNLDFPQQIRAKRTLQSCFCCATRLVRYAHPHLDNKFSW